MKATLIRTGMTEFFTRGVLVFDGWHRPTLELPWRDNARNISCIPAGEYRCSVTYSQKFKSEIYEVLNVAGRSSILFHRGNTTADIAGCILLGTVRGILKRREAVLQSQRAMEDLWQHTSGQSFDLQILERAA